MSPAERHTLCPPSLSSRPQEMPNLQHFVTDLQQNVTGVTAGQSQMGLDITLP